MIYIGGEQIEPTLFPDGTSQVWKLDPTLLEHPARIEWRFENEAEFLHLAQLRELVFEPELVLPYLPYARQDKAVSNTETFALHAFARLLNGLNFKRVICSDPHSDMAAKLIDRFEATYPIREIDSAYATTFADALCYPDKGAVAKYSQVLKDSEYPFLFGEKARDRSSGRILGYQLFGDPADKRVLIVDDICDGGATFIFLAKELRARGARTVHLFVTHGLFTKGLEVLREAGIQRIFTKEREL